MTHARLALIALTLMLLLAACNLAKITPPAPTPYPTPIPPAASSQGIFPSITPLSVGGATSQTVYITATPVPGAAAQTVFVTATPISGAAAQGVFVTATPFGLSNTTGITIAVTPGTGAVVVTAPVVSTNVIDSIINNLLLPAWNFLYTLVVSAVTSLWDTAGARGGVVVQGLCCLIPGVIIVVAVVRLALLRRPRWLR